MAKEEAGNATPADPQESQKHRVGPDQGKPGEQAIGKVKASVTTLETGLISYYSSQAEVMLAQYKNINDLLGATTDWTHPGTHCEVLLRNFFRQSLLNWMAVDKGYIYGRTMRDGKEVHCPEIDILVHDTRYYRPIFRLEDFVIVQPQAVLAIIQVKRTLTTGKGQPLEKGLDNVITAKQHLVDMLRAASPDGVLHSVPFCYSALIGFEDNGKHTIQDYGEPLIEFYKKHKAYMLPNDEVHTAQYVLPDFVGSLRGMYLLSDIDVEMHHRWGHLFPSEHNGQNLVLQTLLAMMTSRLWALLNVNDPSLEPPFAFPSDFESVDTFTFE
jgi:hypothetical protein